MFAQRMQNAHRSFIREILKVTADPSIISFAGGLPNPDLFPVKELATAASSILNQSGEAVLQYSTTEGYLPLREFISARYKEKKGINVDPDEILITSGSQQCLDLIGKIFINAGDKILIERPGYLGAIQAFSLFEPEFVTMTLEQDGPNLDELEAILAPGDVKLYYAVPNFQNPSGISYSRKKREAVAAILKKYSTIFVEDDPYGELRFAGEPLPPMVRGFLQDNGILLGSFSKIAAPGLRTGWIVAQKPVMEKIVTAKQAADLHTNTLSQRLVYEYLTNNDLDEHIDHIKERYGQQCKHMSAMVEKHFPSEVVATKPEGGMFLWITLPEGMSSMDLLDKALEKKVAFVPGKPFYTDGTGDNSFRLNFSNADEEKIEQGIARLGETLKEFINAG